MSQQSPHRAVSAYYHTHWDREWYLPFRTYQVRLAGVVDEILERLETNLLPCFMLDGQTVVLEDYLELRPENRSRLKELVEAGRLSIGPWFVMPDEFLVSGESLIRNLVRGIRESREWGCHQFTGYLPDTFGHSADIPTLLRQTGIDTAVIWRGIDPKHSLFQWQSPSGSRVKTLHLADGYFQMMLHDWTATETEKQAALTSLTAKLEAASLPNIPVLLPIGGDHLAPITAAGHAMLKASYPQLQETTPERFLGHLGSVPDNQLETVQGELIENSGSFLLPGVYSSRMYLKQANRKLEHLLTHQLEPLLALVQSMNLPKPFIYPRHELELAWKTLILNHPHDSICGCSVDAVHRENEVRFDQVQQLGEAMLNRAQAALTDHLADPDEWLVLNTGDTAYTGVVPAFEDTIEDNVNTATAPYSTLWQVASEETMLQDEYLHDGHRIPLSHLTKARRHGWVWAEQVPAFGYQRLDKTAAPEQFPFHAVELTPDGLRNGLISVRITPNGTLEITDLKISQTYPELLQFQALADQGDSYNSAPVPNTEPAQAKFLGSKIILKGPLVAALELTHSIESLNLTLTTEVQLQAESPLIRFKTTFTNHTPDCKLQVSFPTGQPITTVAAENHLGLVTRQYDPTYRPLDHMPAEKMKELKTNTGPVQRFFSTNGQSWITQGLAEYEIYQDTLSLTLMRAFSHLSKKETGVRGAQAGPPFETPEGQCINRTFVCEYGWLPTPAKPQVLYEQAARFYSNVRAVSGSKAKGNKTETPTPAASALLQWEPNTVVTSACYWSPGKGLALRLLNPTNQAQIVKLRPHFPYRDAVEVNFLEEPVQPISTGTLHIGPHEVKTVLFEV